MAGDAQGWWKREATIVGGGTMDALADAYRSLPSAKEVKEKISEISAKPKDAVFDGLYATAAYVSNHKTDMAVGAGLSLLSPRGMLAYGLTAWAAQGLAGALGSATCRALDPNYDLDTARSLFRNDLKHEGRAFAEALPATIAGGIAGRGLANGVLGWNKGLVDFKWSSLRPATKTALSPELGLEFHYGKVSFTPHEYNPKIRKLKFEPTPEFEAKARLDIEKNGKIDFRLPDDGQVTWQKVLGNLDAWRMKKLLVHDLDNAAYMFPEGILGRKVATDDVPGEGIMKAIAMMQEKLQARGVKVSQSEIGILLGETMDANRTHDGAWQLQQSKLFKLYNGTPREFETHMVEPFWKIIDKSRQDYLKAFDGVHKLLDEFTADGGRVAALSDAPLEVSIPGLRITGLEQYMKRLASMQALEPAKGSISEVCLENGRKRVKSKLNEPTQLEDIIELPRHPGHDPLYNLEKPHAAGIDTLIALEKIRPSQALVFDDSRVKGGGAALHASGGPVDFIWFEGQKRAFEPVHKILNPEALQRPSRSDQPGYKASVQTYAELRKYLYPQYGELLKGLLQRPRVNSILGFNLLQQDKDQ